MGLKCFNTMNKREADWVQSAIDILANGEAQGVEVQQAISDLKEALKVRTIHTVCEKCLKIGGCEHVTESTGPK